MHVESHNNNNTTERTRAVLEALNECACAALSVHYDAHACSAGPEGRLGEPSFTPTEHNHTCGELEKLQAESSRRYSLDEENRSVDRASV